MDDSDSDHSASEQPGEAAGKTAVLLDRIDILEGMLDGARSKIMRLEGTADQITDAEIGKKVESLRDAIQQWVNAVERDLREQGKSFGAHLRRALHDDDKALNLRRIGLLDGSGFGTDSDRITWLSGLTTCIYAVLSRHIWIYIHENILDLRYPVGISRRVEDTFDDILGVMKGDGGVEDKILLANKWRSDTIRALIKTAHFQHGRRRFERELPDGLAESLKVWIDRETIGRHFDCLTAKIVRPTIHLQRQMACSSHEYIIVEPYPSDVAPRWIPDEPTLSSWDLMDIIKWRPIYGDIGGVLRPLYPAIYRRGLPGEEDVLALQPVVLMYNLADSETVPGAARRSQLQGGQEMGLDSGKDSQQAQRRSPHPSPERHGQSLSGQLPPADPSKHALPGPIYEEPATIGRDHGGGSPQRSQQRGSESPSRRRAHGKNAAKDEKPSGDHLSDSTDDHKRRARKPKAEGPSFLDELSNFLQGRSSKPETPVEAKARRPSTTQGSAAKKPTTPGTRGGFRRALTGPPSQGSHDGLQATHDGQKRGPGPQRRYSDDDDRSDTIPGVTFRDGVARWET